MGGPEEASLPGDPELETLNGARTEGAQHLRTLPALADDHKWTGGVRKALKGVTRSHAALGLAAVLLFVTVGLVGYIIALKKNNCPEQSRSSEDGKESAVLPPCWDGWIWYRNKCYYFSESAEKWTVTKDSCTALNSTLAIIDTRQELDFLLYHKGDLDRWIGLRRDPGQQWILVNGTKFNNLFKVDDHSECAYLNHGIVKSSECYSKRKWICSKISFYEKNTKLQNLLVRPFG
ncbi:C-type lectin domain family 2 member D-like [Lissotriton helveticus]